MFAFGVHAADAASLYVSPSTGTFTTAQTITVGVYVSSADQAVNAVDATLAFSSSTMRVTSVAKTGSIMSLWAVDPVYDNAAGTVKFAGVVVNPGYTGTSGKIATITFTPVTAGQGTVKFTAGSVLANDGKGTEVYSGGGTAAFTIKAPTVIAPVTPTTPTTPTTSTTPSTPSTPTTPAPTTEESPTVLEPTPILPPTILTYPTSVHVGGAMTVTGTAQVGANVAVHFDTGGATRTIVTVATDDNGQFTATMVNGISGMTYRTWAEALDEKGRTSAPSPNVEISMEAPPPVEDIVPEEPEQPVVETPVTPQPEDRALRISYALFWALFAGSAVGLLLAIAVIAWMLGARSARRRSR